MDLFTSLFCCSSERPIPATNPRLRDHEAPVARRPQSSPALQAFVPRLRQGSRHLGGKTGSDHHDLLLSLGNFDGGHRLHYSEFLPKQSARSSRHARQNGATDCIRGAK